MNPPLPFVGREKEMARLRQLHRQRKCVLVLGSAGVGKSALVARAAVGLPLLVCPESERLTDIYGSLENQLGLEAGGQHLVARKNRLLRVLAERGEGVVFDGVAWTTPKLNSFFACVSERVPVWIAARSGLARDIGHVWPLLSRFERVELRPLHPAETRQLVDLAASEGQVPAVALEAVEQLHHLSAGNPRVLGELLAGLASGHYDPHKHFDLELLDLDRRIRQLPGAAGFHAAAR
jgi:hypothetical protein